MSHGIDSGGQEPIRFPADLDDAWISPRKIAERYGRKPAIDWLTTTIEKRAEALAAH